MVIGLIPTFFSLALILIYVATSKNGSKEPAEEIGEISPGATQVEEDPPEDTDKGIEETD